MSKNLRSKFWATIIYSEDVDKSYILDHLNSCGISYALSPLHDKDKTKDGDLKKAHYHLLVITNTARTRNGIKSALFDSLHGVGAELIDNPQSYYDYLDHDDVGDDFKAVYPHDDIVQSSDFMDILNSFSRPSRRFSVSDVLKYCIDNSITGFDMLIDALIIDSDFSDMLNIVASRAYFFNIYFKKF